MNLQVLKDNIAGVDIYILDQILKDRYQKNDKILDVGCGNGRNLKWFYNAGFEIHGVDKEKVKLDYCKELYPLQKEHFILATAEKLPYNSNMFNHIICNAVLHFADDLNLYLKMFSELLRVLKPEGTLFIRMASNFGIETQVIHDCNGVYNLPDGSQRFLLTDNILDMHKSNQHIIFLEPVKTTVVEDKRSMTTLVLKKTH